MKEFEISFKEEVYRGSYTVEKGIVDALFKVNIENIDPFEFQVRGYILGTSMIEGDSVYFSNEAVRFVANEIYRIELT